MAPKDPRRPFWVWPPRSRAAAAISGLMAALVFVAMALPGSDEVPTRMPWWKALGYASAAFVIGFVIVLIFFFHVEAEAEDTLRRTTPPLDGPDEAP